MFHTRFFIILTLSIGKDIWPIKTCDTCRQVFSSGTSGENHGDQLTKVHVEKDL